MSPEGHRGLCQQLLSQGASFEKQAVVRHHAIHEAEPVGVVGIEHVPIMQISFARRRPTRRAKRWVPPAPGMMPRLTSGWLNRAVSEAMTKSQACVNSQPP